MLLAINYEKNVLIKKIGGGENGNILCLFICSPIYETCTPPHCAAMSFLDSCVEAKTYESIQKNSSKKSILKPKYLSETWTDENTRQFHSSFNP